MCESLPRLHQVEDPGASCRSGVGNRRFSCNLSIVVTIVYCTERGQSVNRNGRQELPSSGKAYIGRHNTHQSSSASRKSRSIYKPKSRLQEGQIIHSDSAALLPKERNGPNTRSGPSMLLTLSPWHPAQRSDEHYWGARVFYLFSRCLRASFRCATRALPRSIPTRENSERLLLAMESKLLLLRRRF